MLSGVISGIGREADAAPVIVGLEVIEVIRRLDRELANTETPPGDETYPGGVSSSGMVSFPTVVTA
jgi:hypothetical protein